jgi:asparagine synthase (glutamine-hydrolysing)
MRAKASMCGIWASVGFDPPAATLDRVAHRGPDGVGRQAFASAGGPVVLAHRRLAIFDLDSRSAQPMRDAKGRYTIVFNGAIYNFRELRDELEREGRRFSTASDTEVLLEAYITWGPAGLSRLNGMFAFVVYDAKKQTIFAARDHYGIKPLYLGADGQNVAFASEIKQLLAVSWLGARANTAALYDYLTFGLTDHSTVTCFDDIHALAPGHYLTLDLSRPLSLKPSLEAIRWYDLPPSRGAADAATAIAKLRDALMSSVELRLSADVPVGSCLSGGLDSSAVVGAIARLRGNADQHTVSAVYPAHKGVDERRFIDTVKRRHPHTVQHFVTPEADLLVRDLEKIVWHQDEPFGSTSIFAQWSVFQTAREAGLTVMLDGQGADELLGGYTPMLGAHLVQLLQNRSVAAAWRSAIALRDVQGQSFLRQSKLLAANLMPDTVGELARKLLGETIMSGWLRTPNWSLAVDIDERARPKRGMDLLSRRMIMATSLPMLLRYEDRNSMAHGIEARLPFLDYRLVDAIMQLGGQYNVCDGESKWLLRRAAADFLPEEVTNRRDKIGFATPEASWICGPLARQAAAGVNDAIEALGPMLNGDKARRDCADMLARRRPYDNALWRLCCIGIWARTFNVKL